MFMYNKFVVGLSLFCMCLLLACNCAFADGGNGGGSGSFGSGGNGSGTGHFGGNGTVPSYQDNSDAAPTFQEYDWSKNDKSIDFDKTTDDFLDSFSGKYYTCNANAFLKSDAYKDIINKGYRLVFIQSQYVNFDIYFFVSADIMPYYALYYYNNVYDLFFSSSSSSQSKFNYMSCLVYRLDKNTYLYSKASSYFSMSFSTAVSKYTNVATFYAKGSTNINFSISKIPIDSFLNYQYLNFTKPFLNFDNKWWHSVDNLFSDFYDSNFNINYVVKNDVPAPLKTSYFDSDFLFLYSDFNFCRLSEKYAEGSNTSDNSGETYYIDISMSALFNTTSKEDFNTIISSDGRSYLYSRDYTKSSDYHVSDTGNILVDTISNIFSNTSDTSSSADTKTFYQTGINSPFLNCGLFEMDGNTRTINLVQYEDKLVKLCSQYASLGGKSPYVSVSAYVFKLRNLFLSDDKKMSNMIASKPVYYVYSSSGISQFMTVDECISYGFLPPDYKDTSDDIKFDGTSDLTDKDKFIINNIINGGGSGSSGGQGGQGGQGGSSSVGDINITVEGSNASANNEGITVNGSAGGGSGNYGGIDLDSGSLSNFGGTVKDINNGWGLLGSNGAIAALSTFWGWFDKQGVITNILIYLILFAVVIGLVKIIRG